MVIIGTVVYEQIKYQYFLVEYFQLKLKTDMISIDKGQKANITVYF